MNLNWIDIVYILSFILIIDFIIMLYKINKKKENKGFEYRFSRYNMYNFEKGVYDFNYGKEDIKCSFDISKDGYLDEIRKADTVFMGGSSAFGVGSKGNEHNISGILKNEYGYDIINLAIPGWNVEQAVITFLKHIERINPKRIILFDGANNLAFGLPFDYHNLQIDSSPYSFYQEKAYKQNYNDAKNKSIFQQTKILLKSIFQHSILVKILYHTIKFRILGNNNSIDKNLLDIDSLIDISIENYIKWVNLLKVLCLDSEIELVIATQPYYLFGQDINKIPKQELKHIYSINNFFDDCMINGYKKLDNKLSKIERIKYIPIFKLYKDLKINLYTDAVHLKSDGYKIIAKYIHKQLGDTNVKKDN
jgi:hypothetical protein